MKAVILAAGKGTRMREHTNSLPNPMLKVPGKPILEHILAGLSGGGIRDVFIVTGYRAEVVEDHFGGGKPLGMRIAYGRQTVQDGTGKAPELAKDFVGEEAILLTYGDILVRPETYPEMVRLSQEFQFSTLTTQPPTPHTTTVALNLSTATFSL